MNRTPSFVASAVVLTVCAACNMLPVDAPPTDSLTDRAANVEKVLARVRDLPFERPVPVEEQDRATLKGYLENSIAADWEQNGAPSERAWKLFGLLPQDIELRSWSADFMADQIGGYYDTETKRYYTIAQKGDDHGHDRWTDEDHPETFLLAHELTHALDDQHFDLGKTSARLAGDDDRALAFRAVCEGNAMDAGMETAFDRWGYPGSFASPLLSSVVSLVRHFNMTNFGDIQIDEDDEDETLDELESAPHVIRTEMVFPYLSGWAFTNRVRSEYGFEAVNTALQTPPESSEQILYPDRYLDRLDRPQLIELPAAPDGFREVYQQTLGLMRTRVLLSDPRLDDSEIDGWDGDRYVLWDTPTGDAVGWLTVWDSVSEAETFEGVYADLLAVRFGPDGRTAVVREGNRVASVINVQDGRAQDVARHLLTARVTAQEGDEGPDRWYWQALRWPVAIRSLHTANEFKVAGDWGIDWRSHEDGFKLRLLNSLALHTENNADRFGFWMLAGLIGGASDRTVDYSYARIPLLFTWHGRNADADRRARFGLALNSIRYQNDREHKSFDLLWGALFHAQWGDREREPKGRLLFIPLWW